MEGIVVGEYPKRRRHKDNPYRLEKDTTNGLFFVIFKDGKNVLRKIEISRILYEQFDRFELDYLKELNEFDNHIEHSEVYEESLYHRTMHHEESIEDSVIRKSIYEELMNAIDKLSDIQKRRIKMYYFDEMNEYEIADKEGTTQQVIHIALVRAKEKLKEILIK